MVATIALPLLLLGVFIWLLVERVLTTRRGPRTGGK